eukprot:m.58263 g.58263  ORF g.58263 m.58263 type:complete len:79 (+) comp7131_c0_seq1:29094-29330(+)
MASFLTFGAFGFAQHVDFLLPLLTVSLRIGVFFPLFLSTLASFAFFSPPPFFQKSSLLILFDQKKKQRPASTSNEFLD